MVHSISYLRWPLPVKVSLVLNYPRVVGLRNILFTVIVLNWGCGWNYLFKTTASWHGRNNCTKRLHFIFRNLHLEKSWSEWRTKSKVSPTTRSTWSVPSQTNRLKEWSQIHLITSITASSVAEGSVLWIILWTNSLSSQSIIKLKRGAPYLFSPHRWEGTRLGLVSVQSLTLVWVYTLFWFSLHKAASISHPPKHEVGTVPVNQ